MDIKFGGGRNYVPRPDNSNLTVPPAGLPPVEMVIKGSLHAAEKVVNKYPELGTKPPAGLSPIEWAQLGLKQAVEKVRNAVER